MIVISESIESERERLLAIFNAARDSAGCYPHSEVTMDEFMGLITAEDLYVIRDSGEISGFAGIYAPGCFIHHLYIDPLRQGRGLGAKLLAFCQRRIGSRARLKCDLCNARALRFYRRFGVTELGSGIGDFGPWLELQLGADA